MNSSSTATTATTTTTEGENNPNESRTKMTPLRGAELWDPEMLLEMKENGALRDAVNEFVALVASSHTEYVRLSAEDRAAVAQAALGKIDRALAATVVGGLLSRPQLRAARAAMRRHVFALATPGWRSAELDRQDREQHEHILALQRFVTPQFLHVPASFVRHPFFNDAVARLFLTCS